MDIKIAHISDSHLTPPNPESGSYFPHEVATYTPEKRQKFFDSLCATMRHAFSQTLTGIKNQKPDFLVHHGDVTAGFKERGTLEENIDEGKWAMQEMNAVAPAYVCLGNHDTGYRLHSTLPDAGFTREGLDGALAAYGDPFWARKDQELLSLGIASPLEDYEGNDPTIINLRNEQRAFIGDILRKNQGDPWVLYSHDPLIDSLHGTFEPHMKEFKGQVHGDLHMPIVGYLTRKMRQLTGRYHPVTHEMAKKTTLAPSSAPIGWRGYEYLTSTYKDGEFVPVRHKAPRTGMPQNPAGSKLKAAWWLLKGFVKHMEK